MKCGWKCHTGKTIRRAVCCKLYTLEAVVAAEESFHCQNSIVSKKNTAVFRLPPRSIRYLHSSGKLHSVIIIFFFFHGLGHLTCSGIDALPSFPGASTISSSSRFVVEGMFWESGVVHSFKMVDSVLFVFESQVLYSRHL